MQKISEERGTYQKLLNPTPPMTNVLTEITDALVGSDYWKLTTFVLRALHLIWLTRSIGLAVRDFSRMTYHARPR
jgi:hypothetical protein